MLRRRKYTVLIVLVVVAASIFSAFMLKKGDAKMLTVTDADGVTYLAVLDQNREVYAGFTDMNSNLYAARIDADGHVVIDEKCYMVEQGYTGEYPDNNTTNPYGIVIDQKQDETFDYAGADVSEITAAPVVEPTGTDVPATETPGQDSTTQPQQNPITGKHLADDFIKVFNSGTFVMTFSTDDPELPENITMALRNGSIYMDTSIEGLSCKVLMDASENKGYIIIPSMRLYCELPDDMMEGLTADDFVIGNMDSCIDIQESTVSLSGRECKCERYIFSDGRERLFYFYGENLVRIDMLSKTEEPTIYNIQSISTQVESSWFEPPKGYLKVNLSWLESQDF